MTITSFLQNLWRGTLPQPQFIKYFLASLTIYLVGIILGAAFYPESFSIFTVYMSYLGGDPNNSLIGRTIYNTCEIVSGILLVPHFIKLYRVLNPTMKWVRLFACTLGILGYLGFAAIGIWHQGVEGRGHQITTWFAFGGLGGAAFFLLFVLCRRAYLKQAWPKWKHIILLYGQVLLMAGFMVLLESTDIFASIITDPKFYGGKFSEWWYFWTVLIWLTLLAIMMQDP